MSEVKLFPKSTAPDTRQRHQNPLPEILQTPSGLALLELQGTINLPDRENEDAEDALKASGNAFVHETRIGKLIFPDYHPETSTGGSTAWMKRVYLYVGAHQRLTGEVKKLPKAIAIIRRRIPDAGKTIRKVDGVGDGGNGEVEGQLLGDELEVVEIVKWKILFSTRPEPVGTWTGGP